MTASPFDPQRLLDPTVYPWPVDEVRLIETHISLVALAGDRVVKLKRPVDLGFVDFRDPARRKRACEDEVRLNQRLTSDVYLGVAPVTAEGVDGDGEPLEWAVVMRRMPAERMLDQMLQTGDAPADLADLLAARLIPFHQSSTQPSSSPLPSSPPPSSRAKPRDLSLPETLPSDGAVVGEADGEILQNDNGGAASEDGAIGGGCPQDPYVYLGVLTDNLRQVAEVTADIVGPLQLELVARSMHGYIAAQGDLLDARFPRWLREGHGDLRCEHICFEPDGLQIYDCVEFEIAIRCADVASDLAFLLMDLRRLGASAVGDALLERYRAAGFELPQPVIDLYAAHRALVRCKVAALARSGNDVEVDRGHASEAASYLDIATSFACPTRPMLVLISGLSGSGKSTVAAAIGRATHGVVLASDRVRKELAGMAPTDSGAAEWHQGIYSDDWTARTYDRLLALAGETLAGGRTAVVDATFLDNEQRQRFTELAAARAAPAMIVWTELDDATARTRIERRAVERRTASDATVSIREGQIAQLRETPLLLPAGVIGVTIDTGGDGPASLDPFFAALESARSIGDLQGATPYA